MCGGVVAHLFTDDFGKLSARCDISVSSARVIQAAAAIDGMSVRECCIQSLVDGNRLLPAEVVEPLADAIAGGVEAALRVAGDA